MKVDRYSSRKDHNWTSVYELIQGRGRTLVGKLERIPIYNDLEWSNECKRVEEMVRLANLGDSLESVNATPIQIPPTMAYSPTDHRPSLVPVTYITEDREKRKGIFNLNDLIGAVEMERSSGDEPTTLLNIRGIDARIVVLGYPEQFLPQSLGQDIEIDVDGEKKKFKVLTTQEKMV